MAQSRLNSRGRSENRPARTPTETHARDVLMRRDLRYRDRHYPGGGLVMGAVVAMP